MLEGAKIARTKAGTRRRVGRRRRDILRMMLEDAGIMEKSPRLLLSLCLGRWRDRVFEEPGEKLTRIFLPRIPIITQSDRLHRAEIRGSDTTSSVPTDLLRHTAFFLALVLGLFSIMPASSNIFRKISRRRRPTRHPLRFCILGVVARMNVHRIPFECGGTPPLDLD